MVAGSNPVARSKPNPFLAYGLEQRIARVWITCGSSDYWRSRAHHLRRHLNFAGLRRALWEAHQLENPSILLHGKPRRISFASGRRREESVANLRTLVICAPEVSTVKPFHATSYRSFRLQARWRRISRQDVTPLGHPRVVGDVVVEGLASLQDRSGNHLAHLFAPNNENCSFLRNPCCSPTLRRDFLPT